MIRSRLAALVLMAGTAVSMAAEPAGADAHHLLFTGDILLARQVAREIAMRGGMSPWHDMVALKRADFVFGNLEGTVGSRDDCQEPKELCFAISPDLVPLLKDGGFTAVGTANNHSGDLGSAGRRATQHALTIAGVAAIGSAQSPALFRIGGHILALISLNRVPGRDGEVDAIPSWQVAQKLRLARTLADWVIVSVHWGKELADWVVPEQETEAKWLVAHGADLIVGAHPHVVQPPACVDGKPVFFSLGNHVFDQKYPMTKHGLIADCQIVDGRLTCRGMRTETPQVSAFPRFASVPEPGTEDLSQCAVQAKPALVIAGQTLAPWIRDGEIGFDVVIEGRSAEHRWRSPARSLLALDSGRLAADLPPLLFTLERHTSPIDDEDGPRPYVYEVTAHGLVARWRGSALAWPLLDARLIVGTAGRAYLCALHRGDAFVILDAAKSASLRTQVYAWNGFGFSGVMDAELTTRCAHQFEWGEP